MLLFQTSSRILCRATLRSIWDLVDHHSRPSELALLPDSKPPFFVESRPVTTSGVGLSHGSSGGVNSRSTSGRDAGRRLRQIAAFEVVHLRHSNTRWRRLFTLDWRGTCRRVSAAVQYLWGTRQLVPEPDFL